MTAFRHYTEEDYDALCRFLIELNRKSRAHINWNCARFEWMAEHPEFDKASQGAFGLWEDGGRIVGSAVYDMYFGEAFCGALPEYTYLYPEILDYAYRELKDEAGLGVAACNEDLPLIRALEAAGFAPAEQRETVMELTLSTVSAADPLLPEGLEIRELAHAEENARTLQWLFWQGFDHGDDPAAFEEDFEKTQRLGLKKRRHFRPALSLAATLPSGEPVSYGCLWFCEGTDYAYVEPVCTVPVWRGKGIAGALLKEAFRRAAALGAEKAYVISDLPFYEKLGFEKKFDFTFYWKK